MPSWIFLGGLLFLITGLASHFRRAEDRAADLAHYAREVRVAKFWGLDPTSDERTYNKKLAEYGKFEYGKFKFDLESLGFLQLRERSG